MPSPGLHLSLSNSAATAVCGIHCSVPWCLSPWRPWVASGHPASAGSSLATHSLGQGSGRKYHLTPAPFALRSLFTRCGLQLSPQIPVSPGSPLPSFFSSVHCYFAASRPQIPQRLLFWCSLLRQLPEVNTYSSKWKVQKYRKKLQRSQSG